MRVQNLSLGLKPKSEVDGSGLQALVAPKRLRVVEAASTYPPTRPAFSNAMLEPSTASQQPSWTQAKEPWLLVAPGRQATARTRNGPCYMRSLCAAESQNTIGCHGCTVATHLNDRTMESWCLGSPLRTGSAYIGPEVPTQQPVKGLVKYHWSYGQHFWRAQRTWILYMGVRRVHRIHDPMSMLDMAPTLLKIGGSSYKHIDAFM